jgi:hypothetical protein
MHTLSKLHLKQNQVFGIKFIAIFNVFMLYLTTASVAKVT